MSWWPQNSREIYQAPQVGVITTIILSHVVEYVYYFHLETLVFFCVKIGPDTLIYIFHYYDSVS